MFWTQRLTRPSRRPNRLHGASLAALLATTAVSAGCGSTNTVASKTAAKKSPSPASATQTTKQATANTVAAHENANPPTRDRSTGSPPPHPPRISWRPIPFGADRKAEMAAYAVRHYGLDTYKLTDPHVIVIHYTETPDFKSTYDIFAPDHPDPELHELPNTCAHFIIDTKGKIYQLVPLGIMCRHTVGLNWTAIGIEHVGYGDQEVLNDHRQMAASLSLVRWLRCRFHIAPRDVIGHNESLSSSYHHENVPTLRTQTHLDFARADMQIYRSRLRAAGACPTG